MKRLVIFCAWALCSFAAKAQSDRILTYDSIRVWLMEENYAAWDSNLQAIRAGKLVPGDLPTDLKIALLPKESRLEWAQVPDSTLWLWMFGGFPWMESQRGLLQVSGSSEISPELAREKLLYVKHRKWIWAGAGFWTLVVVLGIGAGWSRRKVRQMIEFDAGDWQSITDELQSPQANPNIWEDWKAFLNLSQSTQEFGEGWNLLSSSEKEVAEFLVQHLPVSQIAKRMACSQSYVYNLRSSIRRKWDLDQEDDLIHAILAERKGKL